MTAPDPHPDPQHESVKDTLISIIIAFAMAFVFRGFVVEAFVIPTGSMAPTLMGAHMRFRDAESGHSWPVEPWYPGKTTASGDYANPQAGRGQDPISVHDPMTGRLQKRSNVPLQSGDRILVLKYLYAVMEPRRFDVIVFKNPSEDPTQNYIKRLIGLPGEEIALVDGDVFVRTGGPPPGDAGKNLWSQGGWRIARKPSVVQKTVWQTVFDSSFTPPPPESFSPPWASVQPGWSINGRASYEYTGSAPTELYFDQTRIRFADPDTHSTRRETWTIDDRYPYDETPRTSSPWQRDNRFPVSDLRVRAGLEPQGPGLVAEVRLIARGHELRARIEGSRATLSRRVAAVAVSPGGPVAEAGEWEALAQGEVRPLEPGRVTDLVFWHADQTVGLEVDRAPAFEPWTYDWGPGERILHATGKSIEDHMAAQATTGRNVLEDNRIYRQREPEVRWVFEGGPLRLHRVAIDRDLHYQPATVSSGPARSTSPAAPLVLAQDQFFPCGDNSPASLDGRRFEHVNPWVAQQFDDTVGVVPRELLLGRAFFVYWPSLHKGQGVVPVPDFGRMRFIW